ncbi:MAG: ABC transporter permease subunit, partial [Thermomicrobiales bacterium]|nr:ABC transporter permease subunit [Thermomicrobiales bacterium]
MDRSIVMAIGAKEARAGLRNRWFHLYAAAFLLLSVAFSAVAMSGSSLTGQPGFGRTSAGLLNLMLLMVPLIGLTIGAQALVSEREDRLLDYLLAQPVSAAEVYFGKFLGAAAALVLMLAFG